MSCTLEVRNLSYKVDGRILFQGVNIKLGHKDKIAIVGPNGVGKTTLLKVIAGLRRPLSGEIYLFGCKVERPEDFKRFRDRIGFLFQDPEDQLIFPTVLEDVAFGLINKGFNPHEAKEKAFEMLDRLRISHLADRITFRISDGEKKLVALAGVLVTNPDILLLDEPSTGLDQSHLDRIIQILEDLEKTMLIVSHDYGFAEKVTSSFYRLTPKGLVPRPWAEALEAGL